MGAVSTTSGAEAADAADAMAEELFFSSPIRTERIVDDAKLLAATEFRFIVSCRVDL